MKIGHSLANLITSIKKKSQKFYKMTELEFERWGYFFPQKVNGRYPPRHKNDFKNRLFLTCFHLYLPGNPMDQDIYKKKIWQKNEIFFQYFLRHFVNY